MNFNLIGINNHEIDLNLSGSTAFLVNVYSNGLVDPMLMNKN